MAEVAPWLVPQTAAPAASNVAPWLQEQPGYAEDIVKSAVPSLVKGVFSIPAIPGDLATLSGAVANKMIADKDKSKSSPLEDSYLKTLQEGQANLMGLLPTSKGIQSAIEKITGPFYEAKTGPGKAVSTALEVAPSIATVGGPVRGILAKAAGAGAASELAGEGADALKGHLPTSVAPYAEPVARAVGAMAGTGIPSLARKVVTPNPMSDARLNTINALRNTNPELVNASSAGQLTESPNLMALEARAPRMADLPARQGEAYTRGVMRQAGSDGMFDTPGLAQAKSRGGELDALQNQHEMNPSQYGLLNQYAQTRNTPGSELYKEVGVSKAYQDVVDALKNGPGGGNPAPMSMTGPRYGAMKQIVQAAGEGAPTTHEQTAIFDLRQRMQNAFHNSMPADEAQRLRDLDQGYSNYKTIENIPAKVGENTVTPNQVFNKASRGSDLETHANQASSVMTPLPEPNHEGGFGTKVLGGLLGAAAGGGGAALAHSGMAAAEAIPFTSYYGFNHLNDAVQAGKNVAGRIVARPGVQSYLGNQTWRPGPNSTVDRDMLIRLLMAPPTHEAVSGPSK